jgi:energy-coupling factor transport system permease protein
MSRAQTILLGQYRPLDSYLHRLDARAKLLPVVAVMILGLISTSFTFYVVLLAVLLGALVSSGVGSGVIIRNFRPAFILVVITFAYHILFTEGETEPLLNLLGVGIYAEGLRAAGFYSLRLLLFLGVVFVVTLTSTPSDITEAITKLIAPLKKLRVPVDDLGLILFIALRYIPILYDEFRLIKHAQMVRGVRFSGSLLVRVRKSASLLIPVFITAINRADDLALAIEGRGYRSGRARTSYTITTFGRDEGVFMLAVCLGVLLLFVLTG